MDGTGSIPTSATGADAHDADLAEGIRFEIGRSDVTDGGEDASENGNDGARFIRVPIGGFVLVPFGLIEDISIRLDLWNAEVRGDLQTTGGTISWRAFVHAAREIVIVDIEATEGESDSVVELRLAPTGKVSEEPADIPCRTDRAVLLLEHELPCGASHVRGGSVLQPAGG